MEDVYGHEPGEKRSYGRKSARDAAFKLIFQCREQGEDLFALLEEELALPYKPQDKAYLDTVVRGVTGKLDELDGVIAAKSKGWKKERISKVCLSAMRLALYEMRYMDDIPDSVSVNEAVELVKKYEGAEGASFVNGILGSSMQTGGAK